MGYAVLFLGTVRVDGHDVERSLGADPLPGKGDPKGAQVDVLQNDRGRGDSYRGYFQVDVDFFELLGQRQQILVNLTCRSEQFRFAARRQVLAHFLHVPQQQASCVVQIDCQRLPGRLPVPSLS
jgi:hypothetical protein